jgi:hypothetical protein
MSMHVGPTFTSPRRVDIDHTPCRIVPAHDGGMGGPGRTAVNYTWCEQWAPSSHIAIFAHWILGCVSCEKCLTRAVDVGKAAVRY